MLATADSEVSITKDLGTDGADVLVRNEVHKLILISTIVTDMKKNSIYFKTIL